MFNNDYELTRKCLETLGNKARYVLNSTQSGTQTYLYRACRNGNAKMVQLLFDYGAIARPHYYTRYSPLYVACHTGNLEISKLILDKYPSLINIQTIENFLPIHAACSQGHYELVKMLLEYNYPESLLNVYESTGDITTNDPYKYLFAFDLNSCDCNEQTILYTSICSNKYDLCKYLLDLKIKSLTMNFIHTKLDRKKQIDFKLRKFLLNHHNSKQQQQKQQLGSQSPSSTNINDSYAFYEQLKQFLNSKADNIDSISTGSAGSGSGLVASKSRTSSIDSKQLTVVYHSSQEDEQLLPQSQQQQQPVEIEEDLIFFNPFNVNMYSKFGCTCLHEAIRSQNINIIKLLINKHDADINLPIYDSTSVLDQIHVQQRKQISNCLCEALKQKSLDLYLYLLKNKSLNEDTVNYTIKYCLQIIQEPPSDPNTKDYTQFLLNSFSYLLTVFRLVIDKEYKIQFKSKPSDFDGLIINLNSFEPSLKFFYESFLLSMCMFYRSKHQYLISSINDPIELNRLHHTIITRIDLSFNALETIPVCLFQLESLRVLKLNNNQIKEMPTRKNIFDNVNRIDTTAVATSSYSSSTNYHNDAALFKSNMLYTCNSLEELDISNNCLAEVTPLLFYLKNLKHLNICHNKIQQLPFELWKCGSLCELNASHNQLSSLPLRPTPVLGKQQSMTNTPISAQSSSSTSSHLMQRGRQPLSPQSSSSVEQPTQNSTLQPQLQHTSFVEKPIRKVNFWQIHCLNQNDLNEDDDNDDQEQSLHASTTGNSSSSSMMPNTSSQQQLSSNLTELNLSNNRFTKVPSSLSCLTPKLLKLNLSFNLIDSMGSISDYPSTIKFLDLSNNIIKEQIRLINPDMLNYFLNETSASSYSTTEKMMTSDKTQSSIVDFCYLNLINHETMSADQRMAVVNSTKKRQQQKRRTRSHSRNAAASRLIGNNAIANRNPFELFLLNSNYKNNSMQQHHQQAPHQPLNVDYKDEEKLLNSHNLQCFLDKLCVHKKHIKLENLKTLNLSQNKVKKLKLIFNLTILNSETLLNKNNSDNASSNDKLHHPQQRQRHNSNIIDDKHQQTSPSHKLSNIKLAQNYYSSEETETEAEDSDSETKKSSSSTAALNKNKQKNAAAASTKSSLNKESALAAAATLQKQQNDDNIVKVLFPYLTHLDISYNQLKRLPGSLSLLDNLSYLNASNNVNIRKISPRIGLLTKLWNLDLKNCIRIEDPILDTMVNKQRSRTSDILGFLKSILEHSKPYTRIKLMLVGVQAIGKTSLINKLREETTGFSSRTRSSGQTWSERTSGGSGSTSTGSTANISTVGIDINEWIYEKQKLKSSSASSSSSTQNSSNSSFINLHNTVQKQFGPITYRVWDFAGQREYIAIHQYFISKRALYLVCWKLTEEEKGINEIHSWLLNIQTRAPGSPVIIVGTHQDQLAKLKNYKEISNFLQRIIFERFIRLNNETENCAYPPIWASIEVSCKNGYNIKQLANLVYDVACQMKVPGTKDQLILEQKVPVTYLALEDCLHFITHKLKIQTKQPY